MLLYNRAEPPSEYPRSNASLYTLDIMNPRPYDDDDDRDSERSSLISPETPNYGATFPRSPCVPSSTGRVVLNATLKMAVIFAISTLFLGGTLWLALPTLEP